MLAIKIFGAMTKAVLLVFHAGRWERRMEEQLRRKKENTKMKKSVLIAVVTALAAVAGALVAVAVYLRRREKELDEYEKLLFSEEFEEETAPAEEAPAEEAAPVEETPAE